jgi:hypothetical protein
MSAHTAYAENATCGNFLQMDAGDLVAAIKWGKRADGLERPDIGCTHDGNQDNASHRCDRSNTITMDRILDNSDHETGSGAWDYVIIYGCVNRTVTVEFSHGFLYGARIKKASPAGIVIQSGDWSGKDANCCPSHEKTETYIWNAQAQSYILSDSISQPIPKR